MREQGQSISVYPETHQAEIRRRTKNYELYISVNQNYGVLKFTASINELSINLDLGPFLVAKEKAKLFLPGLMIEQRTTVTELPTTFPQIVPSRFAEAAPISGRH